MPPLRWTPEALRDVQRLRLFLADNSERAAARAVHTIRSHVRVIAENPEAGRPVADMDPAFREWLIPFGDSGYVVLYRVEGQAAVVLAIRHQREAGYR